MTGVQINNHFSLTSAKAIERRTVKGEQERLEEERKRRENVCGNVFNVWFSS